MTKRLLILIATLIALLAVPAIASATTWTEYGTFRCYWTNDFNWHYSPTAASLGQLPYYRFVEGGFASGQYYDWEAHYWTGPRAGVHQNDAYVYCHV